MITRHFLLCCLLLPIAATAGTEGRVASESRDASTAYILTQSFVIGHTARDYFDSNSISKLHDSRMADAPPRFTSCTISSASPPPLDVLLNWKWNEVLARADTPKEFVALWQKRNAKYFSTAISYMDRRLVEAETLGGVTARNNVASALNAAIAQNGTETVSDFFKKGEKSEVCKKVIGLMESGAFDIDSRSPMYAELQALVDYISEQ